MPTDIKSLAREELEAQSKLGTAGFIASRKVLEWLYARHVTTGMR